jgi:uncharacterized protein
MTNQNILYYIAIALLVIGGINWGVYGLFGIDLVAALFGNLTLAAKIVYGLVGLAAIFVALVTLANRTVTTAP